MVQHVICRETELNIERLAYRGNRKILEERGIPVELLPPAENIAAERANLWSLRTIIGKPVRRVTGEDCCDRASKCRAVEFESLSSLRICGCRVADEIYASTIARDIKYRP